MSENKKEDKSSKNHNGQPERDYDQYDDYKNIEKYSLSIYHFNLQYMAGSGDAYFKLVKASFQPFLRFFDVHPQWKASLELQGHMIGFLARHFPDDLELLRKLNRRGQIEIVNVHYSDQIYLAYPWRDMVESERHNSMIFKRYGLKRSGVFFAQENFFGEGAEKFMTKFGYKIALINQHFYSHHHKKVEKAPFYKYKNIFALIKGNHEYRAPDHSLKIEQTFSYWDDGELAFARGNNYIPGYGPSEEAYRKHVIKYRKLEKSGYKISRVEDYINRCLELNLKPVELGEITDGSWNMDYYGGVYLWMGTYRLPWERDGEIRSYTYRARNLLLATESFLKWLEHKGLAEDMDLYSDAAGKELKKDLMMAWKHLLLAEVSDSTGQTPVLVEIYYSVKEAADCINYCFKILRTIKNKLKNKIDAADQPFGKFIDTSILTQHNNQSPDDFILENPPEIYGVPNKYSDLIPPQSLPKKYVKTMLNDPDLANYRLIGPKSPALNYTHYTPVSIKRLNEFIDGNLSLLRARARSIKFKVYKPKNIENYYLLDINWHPKYTRFVSRIMSFLRKGNGSKFDVLFDNKLGNYAGLVLPLHENKLIYSPALMEDELKEFDANIFDFKRTWLPLPNGLIGLGNNLYMIKHNYYGDTHLAITYSSDGIFHSGAAQNLGLMTLNPPRKTYHWRLSFYKGTKQDALSLANQINVFPIVKIPELK
ncbi:MAG: hypothetical protein ACTSVC_15725 [Promethearchaeota archaeon]